METGKSSQGIWVFAEYTGACLSPVCFELLTKAQELKRQLPGETVTAVALGGGMSEVEDELVAYGADQVIIVNHHALTIFNNDLYAAIMTRLIKTYQPSILLVGATCTGSDLASVLGVRLNTGVAAHCVDVRINSDGNLVAVVPAFGGKELGDILCPAHRPQIATIKAGVLGQPERKVATAVKVDYYDPADEVAADSGRIRAVGIQRQEICGVPLEKAEVVVAGGWGIGSLDNWKQLEALAGLLGGAIGCTRPAVDEGWVASEQQMIGTSGKTVRPKVYIGAALSGATHHVCGMKDAGLVISINKDPKAPIFEVSDVGVVGDANAIIRQLINDIKRLRE